MRADVFLVDFGHATTRSQAQRLIAAGVEWRLSPLAPWQKVAKNGDDIPSVAEVIIGKQRNGPTGTVKLFFQKSQTRFESLAMGSSDDF